MNYILFDDSAWDTMLPLTYTRPVSELRIGILTIKEKWDKYLKTNCSYHTKEHLLEKFPIKTCSDNIFINGSILPTAELISEIDSLETGQVLKYGEVLCAARISNSNAIDFNIEACCKNGDVQMISTCEKIDHPWDIFSKNGEAIENDFKLLTKGRKTQPLSKTNTIIGEGEVFIERGAVVECSIFNTKKGPVYIGKNAEIMENSVIRGPFAMAEGAVVKMSSKIYEATTLGPYCKAGGELSNVVMQGYSNKGHDGFLGNSVLGEWCNLGADTNSSNLKNNYAEVKAWSYKAGRFIKTGLQFCGLIMGDHAKCGINTMFNTGTIVGVGSNVFGDGFPRNFIPDFSWGGSRGFTEAKIQKTHEIAELVMARRKKEYSEVEFRLLEAVFKLTEKYRESYRSQP
jgi:UDP-N-acetylglucosamine diphosphorylase/glucosamine-1-phosphate N-acetyltransferase